MYRRGSMFGMKDLTAKKWLKEAVEAPKPTSTYILSQSRKKIRLYRENEAFAITFGMSSNINNDGLREDLLLNYSTEKGEDAINKIVDMEYRNELNKVLVPKQMSIFDTPDDDEEVETEDSEEPEETEDLEMEM